jgi:transposase
MRRKVGGFWRSRWCWRVAAARTPPGKPGWIGNPSDWVHRYNEIGVGGLVSRCAPGPAPKLTAAQMEELRALVLEGPDPAVHHVVSWRCVDLRDEVARRFGVTVQERAVGKWLRKLGLTRLQPRPYHPKKDPAAEEAFKKASVLC